MNTYLVILHVEDDDLSYWQGTAADHSVAERKAIRWLRKEAGPDRRGREIFYDLTFRLENGKAIGV